MSTEDINRFSRDIDALSAGEIISIMNNEDLQAVKAVCLAKDSISRAADNAVSTIEAGGSLVYIGAGTSGRLALLDASEMPPTFNVPPDLIRAVMAGGEQALAASVEGAEDNEYAGIKAVSDIRDKDMLLGIAASGKTPYTISALREGKRLGARCWLLACNDVEYDFLDGIIKVLTGPEIIAGSTRLKAGTATKMVLNMLSTTVMIRLGRVYKGYMIDVVPSNRKLRGRALRMLREITGCSIYEAEGLLDKSGGNVKTAVLMFKKKMDYEGARSVLEKSGGSLRKALEAVS